MFNDIRLESLRDSTRVHNQSNDVRRSACYLSPLSIFIRIPVQCAILSQPIRLQARDTKRELGLGSLRARLRSGGYDPSEPPDNLVLLRGLEAERWQELGQHDLCHEYPSVQFKGGGQQHSLISSCENLKPLMRYSQ